MTKKPFTCPYCEEVDILIPALYWPCVDCFEGGLKTDGGGEAEMPDRQPAGEAP